MRDNKQWIEAAPEGWMNIVLKADRMLSFIDPDYEILQIKEKFGGLRYYFQTNKNGTEWDIMMAITCYAEERSFNTCEICGSFGKLRDDRYWMQTLCDNCVIDRDKKIDKQKAALEEMRKLSEEVGEYE